MSKLIDFIEGFPKAEQLDIAKQVIRELSGLDYNRAHFFAEKFGLSVKQSQVFDILYKRSGHIVGHQEIFNHVYGIDDHEPGMKIIHVYVHKIRAKMKKFYGMEIVENRFGFGYTIPDESKKKLPVPPEFNGVELHEDKGAEDRHKTPWNKIDDQKLIDFVANGNLMRDVAVKLGRNERSCRERHYLLTNGGIDIKGKVRAVPWLEELGLRRAHAAP